MKYQEAMKRLKAAGTAQNRKIYRRHGVVGEMFGVSYANLEKLRKDVLRDPESPRKYAAHDHDLALQLWQSGNHDARVLATMLADPSQMKSGLLDQWIRDCESPQAEGAVVGLTKKTRFAQAKMEKWRKSRRELTAAAGWNLLCELALAAPELSEDFFEPYLDEIQESIHSATNRARYAMNNAVIAIGGRSAGLRRKAVQAAKKIGPVDVDHGETGCKTPDAVPYIEKMWQHKKKSA